MKYSIGEEIANAVTHGIGALFSIVALTIMVVFAALFGNVWQIVSVAIYGGTLVLLYTMSTLYHAFTNTRVKKLFKIFDHASIYLLIAGTYTPFTLVVLRTDGMIGWGIFIAIWTIALLGIVFSTMFIGRFKLLSTIIYILMGCVVVFAMPQLIEHMKADGSMTGLYCLIAGGIAYIAGTVFYMFKVKYFHSIWHCFVLLGSVLHFISVMFYVL
ncbi:MAG: channel protein hemolysin family [Clostridia bacterium]|jgi:hemolysin III|nr:channel protein hemolysin family [Clostridia bacterium]